MRNRITLTISEQVKELVYDIRNKAHLLARSAEDAGLPYKAASNMQPSDEDENDYQIHRSLEMAFLQLQSSLGGYLLDTPDAEGQNLTGREVENEGVLTLSLDLPPCDKRPSADALAKAVHAYLVDATLADWFSLTNKAEAELYIARSQVGLKTIRRILFSRFHIHRGTKPF